VLLSDSGMRDHPLTPMTDANLVRVLQAQCKRRVGLVDHRVVAQGPDAIRARFAALRQEGVGIAIVDAVSNDDLLRLGPALADLPLVTAGSGVAIGLPSNFGIAATATAATLPPATGLRAIVSGSCSVATNAQVKAFVDAGGAAFAVDPLRIAGGTDVAADALRWAADRLAKGPVLVYATAEPSAVRAVQDRLGVEAAGALVERTLAAVARRLVERGVRQLVVAGGETSGACVQALDVRQLQIGAQIDPGVPWCFAPGAGGAGLHLALKSGNFGGTDFFTLPRQAAACSSAATCTQRQGTSACGWTTASSSRPTDACLGFLDPARLARLDAQGGQTGGDRASKTIALHTRIYAAARKFDANISVRHPHAQHALRRAHAHAHAQYTARRPAARAHTVLRHEGRPRARHRVPPARRARGGRTGGAGHRAISEVQARPSAP
jgi:hypothetical protein